MFPVACSGRSGFRIVSEPLGSQQGVAEIDEQADGHCGGERLVEGHDGVPLKARAAEDVANRRTEECESQGDEDEIDHGDAPRDRPRM